MSPLINKTFSTEDVHGYVFKIGKFKGHLLTRTPLRYLIKQVNDKTSLAEICAIELKRRGTENYAIEITAHAIDRASLHLLDLWISSSKKNEGLHTWLSRMSHSALKSGTEIGGGTYSHKKILYVFDFSTPIPILKTVMLNPKKVKGVTPLCQNKETN